MADRRRFMDHRRSAISYQPSAIDSSALQEVNDERAYPLGLLLLDPVARPVDEMRSDHARARRLLHPLQRARILIRAPVAPSGDEHRRLIDGAAGEQQQIAIEPAARADAIRLQ